MQPASILLSGALLLIDFEVMPDYGRNVLHIVSWSGRPLVLVCFFLVYSVHFLHRSMQGGIDPVSKLVHPLYPLPCLIAFYILYDCSFSITAQPTTTWNQIHRPMCHFDHYKCTFNSLDFGT